jgi:hypothetical protein
MKEKKIDSKDLYFYHSQNIEKFTRLITMFEKKDENDKRLINALLQIFGEEIQLNVSSQEYPQKDDYLILLYELFMNPVFPTLSLNWFSYEKSINSQRIININSNNDKIIVLDINQEYDSIAARSGIWTFIDNDVPLTIEDIGFIRLKARQHTIKIIYTNTNKNKELLKIEFDLITKSNNQKKHVIINLLDSNELLLDDIDFGKGYIIKNVSYLLK